MGYLILWHRGLFTPRLTHLQDLKGSSHSFPLIIFGFSMKVSRGGQKKFNSNSPSPFLLLFNLISKRKEKWSKLDWQYEQWQENREKEASVLGESRMKKAREIKITFLHVHHIFIVTDNQTMRLEAVLLSQRIFTWRGHWTPKHPNKLLHTVRTGMKPCTSAYLLV